MTTTNMYDCLVREEIATPDEIALVTAINGDNEEAYESILYARTGYRSFESYIDDLRWDDEFENEDYIEPGDLEMGFDPYEGGYTYDC